MRHPTGLLVDWILHGRCQRAGDLGSLTLCRREDPRTQPSVWTHTASGHTQRSRRRVFALALETQLNGERAAIIGHSLNWTGRRHPVPWSEGASHRISLDMGQRPASTRHSPKRQRSRFCRNADRRVRPRCTQRRSGTRWSGEVSSRITSARGERIHARFAIFRPVPRRHAGTCARSRTIRSVRGLWFRASCMR